MQLIVKGNVTTFVTECLFCILILVIISRSRKGLKLPYVRKVGGLEAIDEAIGRATEMGRPVHFSPGLYDVDDAQTLAATQILSYIAEKSARMDTTLIVSSNKSIVHSLSEEIVRNAFLAQHKADAFDPENIRYLSDDTFGYASGVTGILRREKPAANIVIGQCFAESLIVAQTGYEIGAVQICGTTATPQIPFFVAVCDYTLIADEIFAASAYLSQEPVLMGSLIALDFGKIASILTLIVGAFFMYANNKALINILKK